MFTLKRHGGRLESLDSLERPGVLSGSVAFGVCVVWVIVFIRGGCVHADASFRSSGAFGVVGLSRVRSSGSFGVVGRTWVRPGAVGFIRGRWVHSVAAWGSSS